MSHATSPPGVGCVWPGPTGQTSPPHGDRFQTCGYAFSNNNNNVFQYASICTFYKYKVEEAGSLMTAVLTYTCCLEVLGRCILVSMLICMRRYTVLLQQEVQWSNGGKGGASAHASGTLPVAARGHTPNGDLQGSTHRIEEPIR